MASHRPLTAAVPMKRWLLCAVIAFAAIPASASIALFTDGRSMKIDAYKLIDERSIQLTLKSGGSITMPLSRVDRIVDDEVVPPEVVAEVKKIVEEDGGIFPKKSWHYDAASQPIFKSRFDKVIIEAAKKFDVD